MKDSEIKHIVKKSEIATSKAFTGKLMSRIETEPKPEASVAFWSRKKILIGFACLLVLSGVFLYYSVPNEMDISHGTIPFIWSLFLLLGLSHVLSLSAYQAKLKENLPK